MVAKKYNHGFVVNKTLLAGAEEGIECPPLSELENYVTEARLQSKWDKVSREYRDLMLMKQNINREVSKITHVGEKRLQDEILSEVMAEIEKMERHSNSVMI